MVACLGHANGCSMEQMHAGAGQAPYTLWFLERPEQVLCVVYRAVLCVPYAACRLTLGPSGSMWGLDDRVLQATSGLWTVSLTPLLQSIHTMKIHAQHRVIFPRALSLSLGVCFILTVIFYLGNPRQAAYQFLTCWDSTRPLIDFPLVEVYFQR